MSRSYKALFIEDSQADTYLIETTIGIDGIPLEAHFVKNALLALEYLSQLPKENFPDVIITDVNMPMMNGYEFIQVYNEQFYRHHKDTLVFVVSSSIRRSDMAVIQQLGTVEGYFEKPFSLEAYEKYMKGALTPMPQQRPAAA